METSGQLSSNHHSYRKNHSAVTAMLQLSDEIFTGCDENKITTLVTLDQSSAFDVISHDTLDLKLRLYNFSEQVLSWIHSYLNSQKSIRHNRDEELEVLQRDIQSTARFGTWADFLCNLC